MVATLFGRSTSSPCSRWASVIPVAAWELSLGIYLIVKGFRPCPITTAMSAAATAPAYDDVTA